jgi:putative transposase
MPRTARASVGGLCYHVINRGNNRRRVFRKEADYAAFLKAVAQACAEIPMRVLGFCLMPNHFHMVVWPENDGDLSRWMHWVLNTHVRRYHKHYQSSGHVWQGRFKAFPIEQDEHLLTVLRYAERNAVRARLVRRAELWNWSSARFWVPAAERPSFVVDGPVPRPANWLTWVNESLTPGELEALRRSVNRGTPYGKLKWTTATAKSLGLEHTLRPQGRPRKQVFSLQ